MKIGLIQSQGIGDIIIALPIAKYLADRGHEIFWPVNQFYADFFQPAADYVKFLPIPPERGMDFREFSYTIPLSLLKKNQCDVAHVLNMNLPGDDTLNGKLASSLKFDEYKYALTGVPFAEKWNLQVKRDPGREMALHKSLGLGDAPYICLHSTSSNFEGEVVLPPAWQEKYRIVRIEPISDNPLDWLYTIEHAAKRVMVDSMFANLTEQMNITGDNYLVQRSVTALTPVYKNGWRFCWPGDIIADKDEESKENL